MGPKKIKRSLNPEKDIKQVCGKWGGGNRRGGECNGGPCRGRTNGQLIKSSNTVSVKDSLPMSFPPRLLLWLSGLSQILRTHLKTAISWRGGATWRNAESLARSLGELL